MLARSASSVKSSTARSSMAGVRYSTGIDDSGGRWNSARICEPDRVEYPVSSRVTVVIRTSPRSIRVAHSEASDDGHEKLPKDGQIAARWRS
jgi:hypothetical protein